MKSSLALIGGGNMASSLIGGLLAAGTEAQQILVSEPDNEKRAQLQSVHGIITTTNNVAALEHDVVILAIKPQMMQSVCHELAQSTISQDTLFISIAAGVRATDINRWLGNDCAIVRCMPNTPSLLRCGATGLFANKNVTDAQKQLAEKIMQSVGICIWLDQETLLDAVTALSGSGPAYFFLLMEAMQQAGEKLGLDSDTAARLTIQTALGAAQMAAENKESPKTLRARVTSKGGTTESAINNFIKSDFHEIVLGALQAAHEKSQSIAEQLGKDNHGS